MTNAEMSNPNSYAFVSNYPFPRWVKGFFVGLFALVVFSTIWNLRFVQAIYEARRAVEAFGRGELDKAAQLAYAAAAHVPEDSFLQAFASFHGGVDAFLNDKNDEAVRLLKNADAVLDPSFEVGFFLLQATSYKAFDEKDYESYISLSMEFAERYTEAPQSQFALVSAYACQYAITGNSEFREKALQALEKSRPLMADNPSFAEFEQRMMHRLITKDIISREEFVRRFPEGWSQHEEVLP